MTDSHTQSIRGQTLNALLTERGPLPAEEGLALLRDVLAGAAALHAEGRLHRAIGPDTVLVDGGHAGLAPPPAVGALDVADPERCPPELQGISSLELPESIDAAREVLAGAGVSIDPRRIDVYQLGALLCRLLTGQSVSAYLHSPKVKAAAPRAVQPVIDRALGYEVPGRLATCAELAAALEGVTAAGEPATLPGDSAVALAPATATDETTPFPEHSRPPAAPREDELPFEQLGPYRVLGRLGHGGMGDVYLAFEERLQRKVAVKVLPAELARSPELVRRFRDEAAGLARVSHPNVVPVYSVGEDHGFHYFAMQYVEGRSLDRLLASRGRLDVSEVLDLLEQCLAGLDAVHRAGLVHRDVKPGNVLLDRQGRAMLADFGLVKEAGGRGLTLTGVVLGTADYLAPEQARGLPVDRRGDLYALGVVAYQLLSGRLPFQADSATAMIFQHAYERPRPLREPAPDVPEGLATIVERLMAKDPADRYQGCAVVLEDLRRFRAGEPIAPAPATMRVGGRPTAVIRDPDWGPPPALPAKVEGTAPAGWWPELLWRLWDLLQSHAPDLVQDLQGTAQQVDGALAQYQRRRDELADLLTEAREAARELASQARNQREAAAAAGRRAAPASDPEQAEQAEQERAACERTAAELEAQAAEQRQQIPRMEESLARMEAALALLQGQRDALQARLRVVEGRLGGNRDRPRPRARWLVAAVLGVVGLTTAGLTTAGLLSLFSSRRLATVGLPLETAPVKPGPAPNLRDIPVEGQVYHAAFSPDGRLLAAGGTARKVFFWDAATGATLRTTEGLHDGNVMTLAFSPTGKVLATGDGGGWLRLWDPATGNEIRRWRAHPGKGTQAIVYSPDGKVLASGGRDGKVCLWDPDTGGQLREPLAPSGWIMGLAFSGDGKELATVGAGREVRLWDVNTGALRGRVAAASEFSSVVFAPHNQLITGGSDGKVRVWDLGDLTQVREFEGSINPVDSLALSPDGRTLIAASGDTVVRLWDPTGGQELWHSPGLSRVAPTYAALSPDGRTLAYGASEDHFLHLADVGEVTGRKTVAEAPRRPRPPTPASASGKGEDWVARLGGTVTGRADRRVISFFKNSRVKDADLANLEGMDNLTVLSLGATSISDAGLAHLRGLPRLYFLDLQNTRIGDAGVEHLRGLTGLRDLEMRGSQVVGPGLQALVGLPKLTHINLELTPLSDAGLEPLGRMKQLTQLFLMATPITDAGVESLRGLTSLESLGIRDTRVSEDGLRRLRLALPGCKIDWNPQPLPRRELRFLQGNWEMVRQDVQGNLVPGTEIKGLVIEDGNLTWTRGVEIGQTATATVDPAQDPRTIDAEITRGADSGKVMLGIYRLDGNVLVICWGQPGGKERPTQFTTGPGPGSGREQVTYRRARE